MLSLAAPVPFNKIVDFLRSRKLPTLSEMIRCLDSFRQRTQAAVILFELDPVEFRRIAWGNSVAGEWIEDPLVEACLNAINCLAPLDMDAMSMRFMDGEHIDELFPESHGFPMSWDDWGEMGANLDNWAPTVALYFFVTAMRLGDANALVAADEQYGWDLDIDEDVVFSDPNWERMDELLAQHGMSCFKNAINVCLYSTDNPYFDFNPYDDSEIFGLPEFSLEGVRELTAYWQEAQPIIADLNAATAMFTGDPALARVLMMLYAEAVDEQKPHPQTLAEMWAGDDGQEEPVVDEFYGPIGLDPDEDNEEEENE